MKQIRFAFIIFAIFIFSPFGLRAEEILSWQDCIKEAAKNHPDLIAAQEEVNQAVAEKKITASALFPQIDANLGASTAKTAGTSGSSTADSYSYGVSGTQLIFDGTKTISNVRAASEQIQASQQNYKFISVGVRYSLRSAFIDLLKTQEMLKVAQEIYEIRKQNYELITLRYYSGLDHKGALLTAEADLAAAKYDIAQAQRNVEVARGSLVKEMGRKDMTKFWVKGDFTVRSDLITNPDYEALIKNNPSLKQIIAQKNAAEFSLKAAYASYAPNLTGTAGIGESGAKWPPKGEGYNLGAALSMPIFEGGLRSAQVAQAKAYLNQLKSNERSTRDSLILSLQQGWAVLKDALDNVGVQKQLLQANEERSKIAQMQFSTGFITFDNWTIIEDNLVKSKRSYLNAEAAALLAEADWIKAKGETLEYE